MPLTKWVEPEIPSAVNVEDVRAAQAITGALLWIATRSRPDISFSVSKMGQMATKAPKITSEIGRQVLAYLNSTATLGIEFLFKAGAFFSEHGNLSLPRTDGTIEIYSDASHSPGGDRSTQCVIILWRGSPIVWESSRQPFTTLSSAESELVGMVHSVQLAESLQSLIDELLSVDSTMSLMGDNAAAVRAFDNAGGGWRNRHLRMRAVSGRERILAGVLKVSHLPGEYQIADLGTKPLSRVRIFQLLELMNIRSHVDPTEVVRTARMLSRLSLAGIASVPLTAEALAGLALLAAVPRVTAQPSRAEVGPGSNFYGWVAVVCLALFLVWCVRLFRGVDPEEIKASPGDTAGLLEEDQPDSTDHQLRDADCASGGDAHGSSSSEDFHTDEWVRADEKLVAAERRTGLTFIQRARLRRQLLAGEVVDVPVFQQRYGGLPSWLTGGESENVPSVLYSRPSPQVATVAGLFSSCGGTLLALLSSSAVEWGRLRVSCRGLHRNAVLTLVGQARNTRAVVGRPQGENFRAEPGIEPVGARLQEYPEVAQTVVGSSDMGQASDVSPAQLPGFNAPVVRVTTSEDKVTSLKENLEGLSQVAQGSNLGFLRMSQSGHAVSAGPDVGLAGSKEGALEIHGSSEGEDEALEIQGSSDVEDEALVGGSVVASVSQRAERVPQLGSREGSTGSVSNFQQGGSSGSHGMQAAQLSGCYEDYCGEATLVDRFPYVGSWLQVHFLIHLFSQVGEQILWALGERSQDWLTLRSISGGVKCAMSLAVVEVMRRGPHAILFNSPQWIAAVDEFLLTGYPLSDEVEPSMTIGQGEGSVGISRFPYVEGPPGIVVHYLWRVFMLQGWVILDFLGDRVASWGYLRGTADGFRSSTTMAVAVWLRRTGQRYIDQYLAPTPMVAEAAAAYVCTGEINFPFGARNPRAQDYEEDEEIDERPIRPRAEPGPVRIGFAVDGRELLGEDSSESASSSRDSGDSTTEPSIFSVSRDSSVEEANPVSTEAAECERELTSGAGGRPRYEASEGALLCFYVDDVVTVPLTGWSLSEVATIVQGLEVGDWTAFQQLMAEAPPVTGSSSSSGDSPMLVLPRYGLRKGVLGLIGVFRKVLKVVVVLWVCVQGARAQEEGEGQVVPWEPLETDHCRDLSGQVSVQGRDAALSEISTGCDGSVMWEVAKALLLIGTWEVVRRVFAGIMRCRRVGVEVSCQTHEMNIVPMPLAESVPSRDNILFALWVAGFKIDIEQYPEEVQGGFHALVGDYLCRVEDGDDSVFG